MSDNTESAARQSPVEIAADMMERAYYSPAVCEAEEASVGSPFPWRERAFDIAMQPFEAAIDALGLTELERREAEEIVYQRASDPEHPLYIFLSLDQYRATPGGPIDLRQPLQPLTSVEETEAVKDN